MRNIIDLHHAREICVIKTGCSSRDDWINDRQARRVIQVNDTTICDTSIQYSKSVPISANSSPNPSSKTRDMMKRCVCDLSWFHRLAMVTCPTHRVEVQVNCVGPPRFIFIPDTGCNVLVSENLRSISRRVCDQDGRRCCSLSVAYSPKKLTCSTKSKPEISVPHSSRSHHYAPLPID